VSGVSYIDRIVEEQLSQAARNGDLSAPHLEGKPFADLDRQREQGWWAKAFVERELSHDRREVAREAAALAQAGFWRASSSDEVRRRVAEANVAVTRANVNLVPGDRLPLFDTDDVIDRWRRLPR
jgi:hypothetical protein